MSVLKREGIHTVEELHEAFASRTLHALLDIGATSIREVKSALIEFGPIDRESRDSALRDKFAIAALPALLMVYDREISEGGAGFDVAPRCYRIADAMLEARK